MPELPKKKKYPRLIVSGEQMAALALAVWRRPKFKVVTIAGKTYFRFRVPSLRDVRKLGTHFGLGNVNWERELTRAYKSVKTGKDSADDHVAHFLRSAFMKAVRSRIERDEVSGPDYEDQLKRSLESFAEQTKGRPGPQISSRRALELAQRYDVTHALVREYRHLSLHGTSTEQRQRRNEIEGVLGRAKLLQALSSFRSLDHVPWDTVRA
jgi:hypothetical protein